MMRVLSTGETGGIPPPRFLGGDMDENSKSWWNSFNRSDLSEPQRERLFAFTLTGSPPLVFSLEERRILKLFDRVADSIEPVHPRCPIEGHEHMPGQHCVGCADLYGLDKEGPAPCASYSEALRRLDARKAAECSTFTEDDRKFLSDVGIKP